MSNYQAEFITTILNTDFIVRDHRVHGVRIMPGVTFFDIILRALREEGLDSSMIEFREVIFKEPIATSETFDKEIKVGFVKGEDCWIITASSRKVKDGIVLEDNWKENLRCTLHSVELKPTERIDIELLKGKALSVMDMDKSYSFARSMDIHHYEFMKVLGEVYDGESYLLAELHLGKLAENFLHNFYMHPAYLDSSTLVPGLLVFLSDATGDRIQKPFIPLYIETFRALESLGEKCYVYVSKESVSLSETGDVMYSDIGIFNEEGMQTAFFKRMTAKKIRSEKLIKPLESLVGKNDREKVSEASVTAKKEIRSDKNSNGNQRQAIEYDLRKIIAELLNCTAEEVSATEGFYGQGLDSRDLLKVVEKIEERTKKQLYPTLLFEYNDISKLAQYIEEEFGGSYPLEMSEEIQNINTRREVEQAQGSQSNISKLVEDNLCLLIGEMLGKNSDEIDIFESFYGLGLDSRDILKLVSELEMKLGKQLYPTLLFEYTNIKELAEYLEKDLSEAFLVQPEPIRVRSIPDMNKRVYFKPVWEKADVGEHIELKGNILVLEEGTRISANLEEIFKEKDIKIISVQKGNSFNATERRFKINPNNAEDYEKLLEVLNSSNLMPSSIIHAWSNEEYSTGVLADNTMIDGFYSFVYLSKALLKSKTKNKIRILYTYSLIEGRPQPQYAALGGFAKTLCIENPKLSIVSIGIILKKREEYGTVHSKVLAQELILSADGALDLLYSNDQRYIRKIERLNSNDIISDQPLIKQKGVYIITGGLGGLGIVFAKYLATQYKARLVLVGRSDLNSVQKTKIEDIKSAGAEVLYVKADISRREDAEMLVSAAKAKFNVISGIIHSAGVIKDSFIINKSIEDVKAVLAPKVQGTVYLDEALKNEMLDFFVMFSSTAAVMGNAGQCDYAFGNSFMDNYSEYRNELRKNGSRFGITVSINWPLWKEGGMIVDEQTKEMLKAKAGMIPITTQSGIKAFEDILRISQCQVAVIEGEEHKILEVLGVKEFKEDKELKVGINENENAYRNVYTSGH